MPNWCFNYATITCPTKEIYDKCKNTKNRRIYEIILQLYLISSGFRDIALVCLDNLQKPKLEKILKKIR